MRVMALDVGDRRIGIALSDSLGITAQRLTMIERVGLARDLGTIAELKAEHGADELVVGLPLTMRGEEGEQARKVMQFVDALKAHLQCPVHVLDERLTTVQGERALLATDTSRRRRKQLVDQIAAQLILQAYLDTKHAASSGPADADE
jgi:putative Holliday junction resolvase